MSIVSIPSYKTDDPNYRYKMPRLVAKVEGRGNGIRTNIVNMGDIARALKRPSDYPTKFCGYELGAQSKFDNSEGKAIVNGAHEQRDLQVLIDKFIDKFVLCQNCALPEIDLQIKKGKVVYRCNACGSQGEADNAHKLATFIVKNPPDGATSTLGKKSKDKGSKEERSAAKKKKKEEGTGEQTNDSPSVTAAAASTAEGAESGEAKKKKSSSKTKEGSSDKKSKKKKDNAEATPAEDDENKKVTKSSSRSSKNKNGDADGASTPVAASSEDLSYTSQEIVDATANLVAFATTGSTTAEGRELTASPTTFFEHLRLLQVSQAFDHTLKLFIALDALYNPETWGVPLTPALLESRFPHLHPVLKGMTPSSILTAFEDFVALKIPSDGWKTFPYLLQKLYSADLLSEEAILERYRDANEAGGSSSSKKKKKDHPDNRTGTFVEAKASVASLLTWLEEEEEDSSEDEEEEESDEHNNKKTDHGGASKEESEEEEEEDLDIDAI